MTTTTDKLSQLGVSPDDALGFIMGNLGNPKLIFDTCVKYGVTSDMIAEIVQPRFPGATKLMVEDFFAASGLNGNILGTTIITGITSLAALDTPTSLNNYYVANGAGGAFTLVLDYKELHSTIYQSINAGLTDLKLYNWGADDHIIINNIPEQNANNEVSDVIGFIEPATSISWATMTNPQGGARLTGIEINLSELWNIEKTLGWEGDSNDHRYITITAEADVPDYFFNSVVEAKDLGIINEIWAAYGLGTVEINTIGVNYLGI